MSPTRQELIAQLRTMYAQVLEYPAEIVTSDIDLEAELGLDSLQHRLVMARVMDRFHFTPKDHDQPTPLTVEAIADQLLNAT
ncbi:MULTISPECIES: acyl carrier protein [unclassified Nonomuraea]|uniref:acyl carrier protein n=1 Tax=unclassified Nonomuraea TaxID=2593643 RepID=UPI0033C1A1AB